MLSGIQGTGIYPDSRLSTICTGGKQYKTIWADQEDTLRSVAMRGRVFCMWSWNWTRHSERTRRNPQRLATAIFFVLYWVLVISSTPMDLQSTITGTNNNRSGTTVAGLREIRGSKSRVWQFFQGHNSKYSRTAQGLKLHTKRNFSLPWRQRLTTGYDDRHSFFRTSSFHTHQPRA